MDRFMLDKKHVYCEIIEADVSGTPPNDPHFDENCQTVLDRIMDDKVGIFTLCIRTCNSLCLKASCNFFMYEKLIII